MLETRSRWALCIFLLMGTTINYLDRQTLSLLAPVMRQELSLNNESLGLLFSFFYYAYTAAQFTIGGLMDRTNLRWAYGGAVLLWSAVGMATATAAGFASLAVFRVLLGITEAPNWPGALKIVARALPERERPLGNGIFTSGQSIGALTAPLIILTIAGMAGWRMGFVAVGALGAIWFVAWLWFTSRPEFAPLWPPQRQGGGLAGYGEVLRQPRFWLVAVITSCVNPILYFNVNWLPTYFNQERGMAPGSSEMKWILTLIFLALDLGYLAFGFACLHFSRRAVFTMATVLVAFAAGVPWAAGRPAMIALLVAAHFGLGMWMSLYLTFTQEVSRHSVSTAMGLAGGTGSLAGALLMWVVGMVTERTHSFTVPFLGVGVLIAIAWTAAMTGSRKRTSDPVASPGY
jgi:ACS family hexuronate transporter-like MFS transporter